MNVTDNIDEKIRQALNAEDQKILDQFGDDPGLVGMVANSFKGSQWWFTAGIWAFGLLAFGVMLYCVANYVAADDLKQALTWAVGILLCGMAIVIVKIGAWQQMQMQSLMREIKRLELRWMASMDGRQ